MPNIELVLVFSFTTMYLNVHGLISISFRVIVQKHTLAEKAVTGLTPYTKT